MAQEKSRERDEVCEGLCNCGKGKRMHNVKTEVGDESAETR